MGGRWDSHLGWEVHGEMWTENHTGTSICRALFPVLCIPGPSTFVPGGIRIAGRRHAGWEAHELLTPLSQFSIQAADSSWVTSHLMSILILISVYLV